MGSKEREGWSVFDKVKPFPLGPAPPPDALMEDIEIAMAITEHAHSTALLRPLGSPHTPLRESFGDLPPPPAARLADESYRSACAALAAGKPDAAMRSLNVALANCPPEKTSATSRLRSLFVYALSQQQRLIEQHRPFP